MNDKVVNIQLPRGWISTENGKKWLAICSMLSKQGYPIPVADAFKFCVEQTYQELRHMAKRDCLKYNTSMKYLRRWHKGE